MKILNLPLIVHESFPNLDLARAIVRVEPTLEREIYAIAALDQARSLSCAVRQAGDEIAFVGWFGSSPPRRVTGLEMRVARDTVQWQGVYQDLLLGGDLPVTLETQAYRLDELRAMPDEEHVPMAAVEFVSVYDEGRLKSPARLNPFNGVVALPETPAVPAGYETLIDELIELPDGKLLPVARLHCGVSGYLVYPAEFEQHQALFEALRASRVW